MTLILTEHSIKQLCCRPCDRSEQEHETEYQRSTCASYRQAEANAHLEGF